MSATTATSIRRLKQAIGLSLLFFVAELVGGFVSNSLAIFTDAAHLLSDTSGFILALIAIYAAQRPSCQDYTYGYLRVEIFAALASLLSLWGVTLLLVWEAFVRAHKWWIGEAEMIDTRMMLIIAVLGIGVNLILMMVFAEEHEMGMGHSHSHEHGHHHDEEEAHNDHNHDHNHNNNNNHSNCSGHDHAHHAENAPNERTSLLNGHNNNNKASKIPHLHQGNEHDHGHNHQQQQQQQGHDHGHDHYQATTPPTTTTSSATDAAATDAATTAARDSNMEAARLHVLTDLVQSIGVAVAAVLMMVFPNCLIIDPLCTLLFSSLMLVMTLPLCKRITHILMEGRPDHISYDKVLLLLGRIEGVVDVHRLHIWSLSSNATALTAHIKAHRPREVLLAAHKLCASLHITHATIQVQDADDPEQCPCSLQV